MSDDVKDQVKGMAALVISSNRLSEFHEKNLKMFPFVFFEQVEEVKIDYNLSVRHDVEVEKNNDLTLKKPLQHCFIAYYLKINEEANKQNLPRRFETLENSVRNLFWNGLPVEVYFNDRIVFKSTKGRTDG